MSRHRDIRTSLVRSARRMLSSVKETEVHAVGCDFRVRVFTMLLAGIMTGCALSPQDSSDSSSPDTTPSDQVAATTSQTLCACERLGAADHFDAALHQLAAGDYEAARASLARHAASGAEQAKQEASAGLDLIEAIATQNLEPEAIEASPEGARASVLRMLLALVGDLQDQIADERAENEQLSAELDKREEALKRLRELTLGQPES